MRKLTMGLLLCLLLISSSRAIASDADQIWKNAVGLVKDNQGDMAFTNFSLIVDTFQEYIRVMDAQLALGEYHYYHGADSLAKLEFEKTCQLYPKTKQAIIATAYLYKIAQSQKNEEDAKKYQKELVSSYQVALVFKENKTVEYLSGYQHLYRLAFSIDKVEVFVDDHLLVEISY